MRRTCLVCRDIDQGVKESSIQKYRRHIVIRGQRNRYQTSSRSVRLFIKRNYQIQHRQTYGRNQSRRNFTFEDALWRSKDEIDRVYFKKGDIIFDWGDKSEAIFFIVDGQVSVRTLKNRSFALLSTADSFGEYSLITGKPRTLRATAETDCQLFKLSSEWVLSHLTKEHPFVRLTLHQTLSMLSIQNQMKLIKSNDGVYRNPSEPNEADAE